MIQVENLTKRYGGQTLFEGISFKINRRERVGLVGRNGHGKTTLFRLIVGQEEPDEGLISIPRSYRIGYVEQHLGFTAPTVFQEAALSLPRDQRDDFWRVEKILAGLGFGEADRAKHPAELSGGFQVRLNLAKVLLADHNMLLLDEPNNYLDITSIRWLEKFLNAWPGELILVTHDRSFMDKVVTHTLAIHRRKVKKIEGTTGKLYDQIALEEETYEKTRINDERRRKEIENFIAKFRASARLQGLVESRKKTLAKMGRKEKLERLPSLDFAFTAKPFHGKYVLNIDGLTFGYDPERPLIRDFGLSIGARDRVFIIGPNGKGKTTFLKLLAGRLEPQAGTVVSPMAVTTGYFEQTNVQSLGPQNTVLEEIQNADASIEPAKARFLAGMMMFEDDNALKKISILSGGEKSRVLLAKLIAAPVNLLLLDEPTNHLDMDSSDALLAALDEFEGAVIMVTHNELFLDALAERLIVFQDDGLSVFEGTYDRFLEKVGWSTEKDRPRIRPDETEPGPAAAPPRGRREIRKLRSEIVAEKSKVLRPLEQNMGVLEKHIEKTEADIARLTREIVEASQSRESGKIAGLSKSLHQSRRDLDGFFADLEPLLEEYEIKRAEFDRRLNDLDAPDKGAGS
ncbi:MAG TPA: ABC-F family ATP-binding cassette domain-containing protein [Candidatus Aminicenantes bacterium]|nr:ABC-F family ATP-binding cassette domain-containing protein [Acidobacteriota bacterium]OQB55642.1 MAG: putative ABC transporter ATP-binding protein YheS [Candidatus Aminicenantes bacterium ADurb.Bin147]HNQ81475.1 ABC-F family ATP-binding cassette domain-containing protein [Candidatus Aminicenantes bacterium]MDD8028255.1 ABC-F family ATP-binding cassette domain-containing protein [Acidobacteriota bacterium]MDW3227628.1 ABC-F family ATP-binding cassette domain-containing protein [Acidobacterio